MRLAVFNNRFPGFVTTFFARDMRGLLEAGIDVDVFAIHPLEPELWRYVPEILDEKHLPRDKVHHISLARSLRRARPWPLANLGPFLKDAAIISASAAKFGIGRLAKTAYVLLEAWTWAQENPGEYDHILSYWGNYSATCAYVYHRLTAPKIPFSIFLHAGMDLYGNQVYLRQKLLHADNIIVVCEFNRRFIHKQYPDIYHLIKDRIHTHHIGLDLNEFGYEPCDRPSRKILAVGRLSQRKGFEYLIQATHELKSRGMDVEVELIGDGEEMDTLKALAREFGVIDRVRFRGWITSNEVRVAMRQVTVLVHPSADIGDAVPTVIKEAMAVGTPVIASNVAGIPELLDNGRCGLLVPPKDVRALADGIGSLLADETMRRKFADAAREYAEQKFDLWRNGQRLADLLRSTTRSTREVAPLKDNRA